MSGKRHHFIPQFLQRGFTSHSSGRDVYTWVYRKNALDPFNSNIKNIGLEGYFYSSDKESILDDVITKAENEYGEFIDQLRQLDPVNDINALKAAEFISHLEARTKNIRVNFKNSGQYFFEEISKFLSNPENCKKFVLSQIRDQFDNVVNEELIKLNIPRTLYPIFKLKIKSELEKNLPFMEEEMLNVINLINKDIPGRMEKSAKDGHIKALLNSHSPAIKIERYKQLRYQIILSNEYKIPLGDSGVIFYSNNKFKPFLDKDDNLTAVLLPISSNKILIGSKGNFEINFSEILRGIASCSIEFFISDSNNDYNRSLIELITSNTDLLTEIDIQNIIKDLIKLA